jgi:NDP-4-keto-2,6-dideoxyhexose 3-C-methyltransferase
VHQVTVADAFNGVVSKRECCVSCGSPLLPDLVEIGEQFPSAVFLSHDGPEPAGLVKSSLNLTRCANDACALIQLSWSYDLQYVFDHYPYESGTTATMRDVLGDVIDDALRVVPLTSQDVVLDIGGNDGTLLSLLPTEVRARVNIDASAVQQRLHAPNYVHVHDRFSATAYKRLGLPSPRLITSVAMFYHLSDPISFCRDVADIMSHQSVWILQMTYVGTMLRDLIVDNVVHEHVAYYSLKSLEHLLGQVDLKVADAKLVPSYGGSLRVFIVRDLAAMPADLRHVHRASLEEFERTHSTNELQALLVFGRQIEQVKQTLRGLLGHLSERHGPIWGFGASTKGNMLLQWLEFGASDLPCILDNSAKKIGRLTTGSRVPIVDERTQLPQVPDYLLALPYYYADAFVRIIQAAVPRGRRVYLIVPLPYPKMVPIDGLAEVEHGS